MKILVFDTHFADDDTSLQLSVAHLYPDSAVIMSRKPLFVPDWGTDFATQLAVAARICRLGKHIAPRFVHRYWDAITAVFVTNSDGNDRKDALTAAFDGAIALGQWMEMGFENRGGIKTEADSTSGQWRIPDIALQLNRLIDQAIVVTSRHMTVKMGDIIALRLGESHPIAIGDCLNAKINGHQVLTTKIK